MPLVVRVVVAACVFALPGCMDMGEVQRLRDESASLRDRLKSDQQVLEATLHALPADSPTRPYLQAELESSRTALEALSKGIEQVDQAVSAANNPGGVAPGREDSVGSVAGTISSMLPGAWRAPVILSGALLAALARARQLKTGLASVARGIELAKRDDEDFRKRFQAHAATFRAVQTPVAQRTVDEVTTDGFMVRSPI